MIRRGKTIFAAAVLLGFILFPLLTFAATIKSIEITGNKRTPDDAVRAAIKSSAGGQLSPDVVDSDIKSIYALGQFRDVYVTSEPDAGGVKLTYVLEEKPLIAQIEFEGNKKIKSDDLRSDITQNTFSVLNEHLIAQSMQKIREAYSKKGYYLADVDYHIESTEKGESKLVFDIRENQGVIVRKIMFIGNKVYKDKDLRKVIRTREKSALSFLTGTGKYEEEMLRNDTLFLTYHYLNNGYLKVKVSPPKVTISKDKRYIYVTFDVYEGNQYKIGNISISGDILTTKEELSSFLKTKPGQIYSQRTLEEDIMMLTDRYGDEGYAFANINPDTVPNDDTLTADIDIQIMKGKKVTIEKINIEGNTTTRDKVIRRELAVMENDRYSVRSIQKSRENLMRLGYFEDVSFATPRGTSDDKVMLNITVKEKATGSFNISAAFSTYEKFILSASVQKENFLGSGIGGSLSGEISQKRQLFMLSLNDPYFLDTKWMAGFSVYRDSYLFTSFKRSAFGGSVNLGHRFFDHFKAIAGYQAEDVKVDDFSFVVPQGFKQDTSGFTSELNLSLERDTRDNMIVPMKGMYNILSQEVSGAKLGGTNDFYRTNFKNMFYYPVWKTIVFKQFARIGYIKSLNNKAVPLYERYYLGGPNSLRGYYPNSIGPSLRIPVSPAGGLTDFIYGGNKELLFVTELEVPLYDKAGFRAVGFFDAGNTYAENQNYSLNNLRMDYGFGFRWNSPMGPLRFEWGIPIERQAGEDSFQFNFTIGNFF